jgi:myosin heavy subunit
MRNVHTLLPPVPPLPLPVERVVWWSNDVVEAFANAMTPSNPNSSRMALSLRLTFNAAGVLSGGTLGTHCLEARRVFQRELGDRNFHIFFQVRPCSCRPQAVGRWCGVTWRGAG